MDQKYVDRSKKIMLVFLIGFCVYLYWRIGHASGLPVVHVLWSADLAKLMRIIAKALQLLGGLTALSVAFRSIAAVRNKQKLPLYQLFLTGIVCGVALVTPDLAKSALPLILGVNPF